MLNSYSVWNLDGFFYCQFIQGDDEEEEKPAEEQVPGEDGEQEQPPEEPEETRIDVELPKLTTNLGDEMHFVKLPNFLSVEAR